MFRQRLSKLTCILGFAGLALAVQGQDNKAYGCNPEGYLGSICYTAANYCPRDFVPAFGQMETIADNMALFAIVGGAYGGDMRTHFGLPDLRGREMIGPGRGPGLTGYERGEMHGADSARFPTPYMAAHSHGIDMSGAPVTVGMFASSAPASTTDPSGNYFAAAKSYSTSAGSLSKAGSVSATLSAPGAMVGSAPTGDDLPVSMLDPQLGLLACVNMAGIFPPRP